MKRKELRFRTQRGSKEFSPISFLERAGQLKQALKPVPLTGKVIGTDFREPVFTTNDYPWRVVCSLVIRFAGRPLQEIATGWFAGPRTVITAGHAIYNGGQLASSVDVFAGRFADQFYRAARSEVMTVHENWKAGNDEFDYGAIFLKEAIGTDTGFFVPVAVTDETLRGLNLSVVGYPADIPRLSTQTFGDGAFQFIDRGNAMDLSSTRFSYEIDTEKGQSGSPVFAFDENENVGVVGIHTDRGGNDNSAVRINNSVKSRISAWNSQANKL